MSYIKPHQLYRQFKESRKPQRLLAIDTGGSCTGFAVTSLDLSTAQPLVSLYAKNPKQLLPRLTKLIEKNDVGGCLVGYSPVMHDQAKEFPHRDRVFHFLDDVFGPGGLELPFTFVNEESSSQTADDILRAMNVKGRHFRNAKHYEIARNRLAAFSFTQKWLDLVNIETRMEAAGAEWNRLH